MESTNSDLESSSQVYDVLADLFLQQGVSKCFALLGDANMYWAAALATRGVDFVYVRDEHCGVAAAMSYARTSGKTGLATVTCGPGLTQILTALPAAARASIPLVVFSGEAPLKNVWYNQAIDQRPFVEACGVEYVQLHDQAQMPLQVAQAFDSARKDSRPVVIGAPMDFQEMPYRLSPGLKDISNSSEVAKQSNPTSSDDIQQSLSHSALSPAKGVEPSKANHVELQKAVQILGDSKRPVVLAGLGAVAAEAGPACRQLAEQVGALLATTLPARGLFHDDPFYLGIAGGFSPDVARQYLMEADLIIAIGTKLTRHTTDQGKLWQAERVLHIDLEPLQQSQGLDVAQHQLQGDARVIVEQLSELLANAEQENAIDKAAVDGDIDSQWRTTTTIEKIANTAVDQFHYEPEPGFLDPRAVIEKLNEVLPADCHTVNSSGHCSWFAAQMPGRQASHFFTLREFGAIGNGLAFAMGVAVAHPDRRVVLFDGDGSFLMHVQELETIIRHRLNILVCVLNDGGYGSEVHKLRAHGKSEEGAFFGYTDLSAISSGFGLPARVIDELDSLQAAWQDLESGENGAAVWDIRLSNQVVSPVIRRAQGITS